MLSPASKSYLELELMGWGSIFVVVGGLRLYRYGFTGRLYWMAIAVMMHPCEGFGVTMVTLVDEMKVLRRGS